MVNGKIFYSQTVKLSQQHVKCFMLERRPWDFGGCSDLINLSSGYFDLGVVGCYTLADEVGL